MQTRYWLSRVLLWTGLVLAACQDTKDPTPISDLITLDVDKLNELIAAGKLVADGTTRITLVAKIPKESDEANRMVLFSTSAGQFDVAAADKLSKAVYATLQNPTDAFLSAKTELTLGTTSGKYLLKAAIQAKTQYSAETTIDVLPIASNSLLSFRIENKASLDSIVRADGTTRINLIATVPQKALETNRTIVFTTSEGSLDVAGGNARTKEVYATLERPADSVMTARAVLTLSTNPGNYVITAAVKGRADNAIQEALRVLPPSLDNLLNMMLTPVTGVRADGISTIRATALVTNTPVRNVVFATSAGAIITSTTPAATYTVAVNQAGAAEAVVQVGSEVGNYLISSRLENTQTVRTQTVVLERAYPDSLIIEPSALAIDTLGGSITLDVYLRRNRGKVSNGTLVTAAAYQVDNTTAQIPVGRFIGTGSGPDNTGKISVRFFADTGKLVATRPIFIRIASRTDNGATLSSLVRLTIR